MSSADLTYLVCLPHDQGAFKAALNVVVADEQHLGGPDYQMRQRLKSACTHTETRTAGPLVIDRGSKLLLPLPLIKAF
jgi:hypothetical protein